MIPKPEGRAPPGRRQHIAGGGGASGRHGVNFENLFLPNEEKNEIFITTDYCVLKFLKIKSPKDERDE